METDCLISVAPYRVETPKRREKTPEPIEERAVEHAPAPVPTKAYIEKLAKPKKPAPPVNPKKKTVAFGRTVNVSQCIEGISARNRFPFKNFQKEKEHHKDMDKENPKKTEAPPPVKERSAKAVSILKETQKEPSKNIAERNKEVDEMSNKMNELLQRIEFIEKLQSPQPVNEPKKISLEQPTSSRPSYCRNNYGDGGNSMKQSILSHVKAELNANPSFLKDLIQTCLEVNSEFAYDIAQICRPTLENMQEDKTRIPRDRTPNRPMNPAQDGRMFMATRVTEQSVHMLSPTGQPFSVASRKFIERRIVPENVGQPGGERSTQFNQRTDGRPNHATQSKRYDNNTRRFNTGISRYQTIEEQPFTEVHVDDGEYSDIRDDFDDIRSVSPFQSNYVPAGGSSSNDSIRQQRLDRLREQRNRRK